jgi:hypothetical protein
VSVTVGITTYSTADGSLKASGSAKQASGNDRFGSFTSQTQLWTAGGTPFATAARVYTDNKMVRCIAFPFHRPIHTSPASCILAFFWSGCCLPPHPLALAARPNAEYFIWRVT